MLPNANPPPPLPPLSHTHTHTYTHRHAELDLQHVEESLSAVETELEASTKDVRDVRYQLCAERDAVQVLYIGY